MVTALITMAAIAWSSQILLGGWQLYRFNRALDRLCRDGRVGVGRAGGRFRPRVVIAVALNEENRICGTLILRGLTVLAAPAVVPALQGRLRQDLDPAVIFPDDPCCQQALISALKETPG